MRSTRLAVADVTTLNFNLLFEIGFALGLGAPVLPIRDTSNIRDSKDFEEMRVLDTPGSSKTISANKPKAGKTKGKEGNIVPHVPAVQSMAGVHRLG